MINIAMIIGEKYCNRIGENVSTKRLIRFICMPGIKPVKMPVSTPINIANIISINIPRWIQILLYVYRREIRKSCGKIGRFSII